ncbi:MAG: hypothetical protein NZ874_08230 [Fimbriimonadales bacterium]|nr:hypothetical protein [Fimbriimonadales bacterium]
MRAVGSIVFLFAVAGAAVAVESLAVVPRNSYLIRPVGSARELAAQIRTEPVVAQRYARHFRRSAWEFAEYVENNLRLTRLSRAQAFNVYYAPPNEQILVVRRILPKGTPVFVEKRTGRPVLKANCGNPLTPAVSLPNPSATNPLELATVAAPTPTFVATAREPHMPTIELVDTPETPIEEVVVADVLPTETLVETLPEAAPDPEAPPALAPVAMAPAGAVPPNLEPPLIPRLGGFGWMPFLPFVALAVAGGDSDFEPIPEPTSALVLSAGLCLLYPFSRRVLRRAQNSSQRTGDSSTHSA